MNWKDRYSKKKPAVGKGVYSKNIEPLEWEQSDGDWCSPDSHHAIFSGCMDGGVAHTHPNGHWGVDFAGRHGTSGTTVHGKARNMEKAKGEVEKFLHNYSEDDTNRPGITVHDWQSGPEYKMQGGGDIEIPRKSCPGCEKNNWHEAS